jgi:predicted transporter
MGLDLRWPIGLMFSLIGTLLAVYGLITNSDQSKYASSLGLNINLYWGLLLLVFGSIMITMAWKGGRKDAAKAAQEAARSERTNTRQ